METVEQKLEQHRQVSLEIQRLRSAELPALRQAYRLSQLRMEGFTLEKERVLWRGLLTYLEVQEALPWWLREWQPGDRWDFRLAQARESLQADMLALGVLHDPCQHAITPSPDLRTLPIPKTKKEAARFVRDQRRRLSAVEALLKEFERAFAVDPYPTLLPWQGAPLQNLQRVGKLALKGLMARLGAIQHEADYHQMEVAYLSKELAPTETQLLQLMKQADALADQIRAASGGEGIDVALYLIE